MNSRLPIDVDDLRDLDMHRPLDLLKSIKVKLSFVIGGGGRGDRLRVLGRHPPRGCGRR